MSNTLKGEVGFAADGRELTLVYSINAIIALEEELGVPITRIGEVLSEENFSYKNARTFFWAGLIEYHDIALDHAGTIMSEIGMDQAIKLATESLAASMPQEAAKGTARPRPAPGTGKRS